MTDFDPQAYLADKATPTQITPELLSRWEAKAKECVNGGFLSRADVMGLLGEVARLSEEVNNLTEDVDRWNRGEGTFDGR